MGNENYFIYHLHSDYSSCTTNIDSVTKVSMYVNKAREQGMSSLAFSEHGNMYNWYEKKTKIEAAGMKYVHAVEAYLTESLTNIVRDNYHCVLLARNEAGFHELNKLVSKSFNRKDGHFYYTPRITFDELFQTSNNILVTSACVGGVFGKGEDSVQKKYLEWLSNNKDRCFLEIQHHDTEVQIEYNKKMLLLSQHTGLRLIAGTDTHNLNERYAEARVMLQKAKHTFFEEEEGWDMSFKSYDELVQSYIIQNAIPKEYWMKAIQNTKVLEEMIEPFELDTSPKFPDLYPDVEQKFLDTIESCIQNHPYALKNHTYEELHERAMWEFEQLKEANMLSFLLFKKSINDWQKEHNIHCGVARGSVAGSMIAYLFGITELDSMTHNLNFFRFCNSKRVSNPDIDEDLFDTDRDAVRHYLLERPDINSSEIVSFGTIKMKGAIRDVARAMEIPLDEVDEITDRLVVNDETKEDEAPDSLRQEYPKLFEIVDIISGVITSVGTHPAGVLCATRDIESEIGTTTLSTTDYPVSMVDMYALDALMWTKMDELGLDNVGIINKTCELAGIERVNPDNIDLEDMDVWTDISNDTTAIFQFEKESAAQVIRSLFNPKTIAKIKEKLPNISMLKLFAFANVLLRPSGASIRDKAAKGEAVITGVKDIDDLLANELGFNLLQDHQMLFAMQFCGFDMQEADALRKCLHEDSLVTMADGTLKKIKDVHVGEYVLSFDNLDLTAQRIMNKWNNGTRMCVVVITEHGGQLICTADHKIYTTRGKVEASKLTDKDYAFCLGMKDNVYYRMPERIVKVIPWQEATVYDIEVEKTHCFLANGLLVSNCVAKKKKDMMDSMLEKLQNGFIEHSKPKYDLSDEDVDRILSPIIQCIKDSSRYTFNLEHAVAYSYIGYACGYLRHYYPVEFVASCLNVWESKEEKTSSVVAFAKRNKITISEAKFRHSKAEYIADTANRIVYKGIKSIKSLNAAAADALYTLKDKHYDYFIDLLYDMRDLKIDSEKTKILIRLDFFSEFGNPKELLALYNTFNEHFKKGKAVQFKKESISEDNPILPIIKRHSNETAKQYTKMDTHAILQEFESYVKSLNMSPPSIKETIATQQELLGYINLRLGEADRTKLYVLSTKKLIAKTGKNIGKPWCVVIRTQSIGSGIIGQFTVPYTVYSKEPFKQGDIINCDEWKAKLSNGKKYFYITKFHQIY